MKLIKALDKWFSCWIILSLVVDIGLIAVYGWTEFVATGWWKSLLIAALATPFALLLARAFNKTKAV